ncbi:hypothetical protein K4749_19765 [Streptomyces sp. TRM72054]|uniref:hypothetical protein n=1 Tax=Streptomyces sp. TRM72054 TaxID=2870562 RepID=UPI001C8C12F3|nr:hypothetical protein [Streptomyces sp. TRM72054]MBX9395775.1 hypothetical protein [Streptomyces sp. TRM72054]
MSHAEQPTRISPRPPPAGTARHRPPPGRAAACAPCRKEAPELVRLAEKTEPLGVRFLGVNIRAP